MIAVADAFTVEGALYSQVGPASLVLLGAALPISDLATVGGAILVS